MWLPAITTRRPGPRGEVGGCRSALPRSHPRGRLAAVDRYRVRPLHARSSSEPRYLVEDSTQRSTSRHAWRGLRSRPEPWHHRECLVAGRDVHRPWPCGGAHQSHRPVVHWFSCLLNDATGRAEMESEMEGESSDNGLLAVRMCVSYSLTASSRVLGASELGCASLVKARRCIPQNPESQLSTGGREVVLCESRARPACPSTVHSLSPTTTDAPAPAGATVKRSARGNPSERAARRATTVAVPDHGGGDGCVCRAGEQPQQPSRQSFRSRHRLITDLRCMSGGTPPDRRWLGSSNAQRLPPQLGPALRAGSRTAACKTVNDVGQRDG